MSTRLGETVIGFIVLLVAASFALFVSRSIGTSTKGNSVDFIASFASVGSITTGTDIRLAGVKIGTVTDISLDHETYDADVTLHVQSSIPIPEDSVAKIVSDGLLGAAYVSIEPGAEDEMLSAGAHFEYTQGAVDLLGLLGQFAGGKDKESAQ